MLIKELTLFTDKQKKQEAFYQNIFGFKAEEKTHDKIAFRTGASKLIFQKSKKNYFYHYCFLIPCNQLENAIKWLKQSVAIIQDENGTIIHRFESWNANAVYFYDGAGNIVEFIVRHDLKNESDKPFDSSQILCINEIGMPTTDIRKTNRQLENEINTRFWKGDFENFGTNGDQHGLFLLPNYKLKTGWFPVNQPIQTSPFNALIENDGKKYRVEYHDEQIKTSEIEN